MGERAAGAQQWRADRRLHLVLADRPDGLGYGYAGGKRTRPPRRALRPRPEDPAGRRILQGADPELARRAARAKRLPDGPGGHAGRIRGAGSAPPARTGPSAAAARAL